MLIPLVINSFAIEVQDWDEIFSINVRGTFLCTKHVLPYMMKKKSGSIVNFSSIYAINKIVADHYYSFFINNPSSEATNYLKERGIEGKTVKDFLIGFSENNQTQLLNALLKQFSEKIAIS